MTYRSAALCVFLLLGACSPNKDEKAPQQKLFEEQRNALDTAKTVNPGQQQRDEEQRKEIDKQTQ